MKKIKIMHFVSGIGNDGVTQFLTNYTSRLNKKNNVNEIIVYQHKPNATKLRLEQSIGNKTYRVPFKAKHPIKNLFATYRLIKKEKPDIVEAHMNLVNFFPLSVAWFCRVPVRISHSHIAQDIDNINPKLSTLFKKLCIIFSTNLVACGENAGKYMYGNRNFHIVYNAINLKKYSYNPKSREEVREKYGIDTDSMIIGNIGRINIQKNQKFLIDIFADYLQENPNAFLFIIGNGEPNDEQKLVDYIKKKSCQENVIRIEGVKSTEKFYSAFDIFALPSLYEGLPVVGVEAQASGVTTLLSKNIDPSVVYSTNTKLLPIDQGTRCWIENFKRTDNRSLSDAYNEKYNIDLQFKKLYKFYSNLLNNK
ncbi:glycosyltransferase [Lactobacillus crispatus]|uniref:Glycosyltransferase n=1 Tax=Lactobacillus crispatus TaxID=47770 RepID=A0AB37DHL9_9LACO|nr:glycosyltransferase [Lactobacillus crispatus]OCX09235.1 hypothetical protein BEV10_08610 [Lactobacillus crispatus]QHQ68707.1 glycosyltransferase [Lactobacillus crispatus]